ncbi:MAG: hypothetical protein MJK04_19755, partial [Psychrosphaera sp.]|nr:hypothetical protein [Psychrosphaera sp.]
MIGFALSLVTIFLLGTDADLYNMQVSTRLLAEHSAGVLSSLIVYLVNLSTKPVAYSIELFVD